MLVDIAIPVLNEENALPDCVANLLLFVGKHSSPHSFQITIVDNGSIDGTLSVAKELANKHPGQVQWIHLSKRGRGRALKKAWLESTADIVSYMDVDLSTGLEAFPRLIEAIEEGHDLAVGSRLMKASATTRSLRRELISRIYNWLIRLTFRTKFSDAQCGFKAMRIESARVLVPLVDNDNWFFDTELLIIAEKRGFNVMDVAVTWEEDSDTRVKLVNTILEDLKGLARLRLGGIPKVTPPWR